MLPAALHAIAFAISLFVQSWNSPLAGAWVFFHLAGCAVLLYGNDYSGDKGAAWYACLAWLIALCVSAFLFAPVRNGAATLAVLSAMPSLALCLRREHLKLYAVSFLFVASCYAFGLIVQGALNTQVTAFNYTGRHSWPILDPNNAAAVLNLALLPCVYLMLFRKPTWAALVALFAWALLITGSKAGLCAAAIGCLILFSVSFGIELLLFTGAIGAIEILGLFIYRPELIVAFVDSFRDRFPIWDAAWPLVWVRPFGGLGLGSFAYYYAQVRTEGYTAGWHSHNDLLQLAIEVGVPAALIFVALLLTAAFTTCRANLASAVVILAITLEAMVEFQFYVPAVSLPMGLALGYHIINRAKKGF